MRALVLNLEGQSARLAVQQAQLAQLGIAWERIEATTPDTLSRPAGDRYWSTWERPLRDTEKAVLESHRRAWALVAERGAPCLILEDDALLARGAARLLEAVEGRDDMDHLTLETRGRRKLLGPALAGLPLRRLYLDRTGAAAYVLWPSGAAILLARTARAAALADAAICSAWRMRSFQAVPALAIQIDQCARYGIVPPIAVKSTIDVQRRPDPGEGFGPGRRLAFRLRRIGAQLRMGLRQLSHATVARRELVAPAPAAEWPALVLPAGPQES